MLQCVLEWKGEAFLKHSHTLAATMWHPRMQTGRRGDRESAAASAPFRQCDRQGSPLLSCPSVRQRSRGSPRVMAGAHAHTHLPSMACDGHGLEWHVVSQALGRASGGGLAMKQGENQARTRLEATPRIRTCLAAPVTLYDRPIHCKSPCTSGAHPQAWA
ncbi:hypothetical protein BT67DRAFT_140371 [Trichocladium antarcticum]|uniref:Uncharacterized protein n=1 Tax=Trichocladium antarcticum TaxID=1450529 RepID=A0AAN6ZBL4_9PEZI|nr:hypothetical protein BT67DRAFT_140371 [Trichocladium antarcticum]